MKIGNGGGHKTSARIEILAQFFFLFAVSPPTSEEAPARLTLSTAASAVVLRVMKCH